MRNDYLDLLESRAKRLTDLLAMAAPDEVICQEVILILKATLPLGLLRKELLHVNQKSISCATG